MTSMTDLSTFLVLLAVAYVVPGPDFAPILASAVCGRRLGRAAAAGVVTGLAVHAALAAAGLSSLIAATSWGLPLLRILGGAFLVWAGVGLLRAAPHAGGSTADTAAPDVRAAWRRGLLGNLLNPKTLLFFLALIPQFVDPARPVGPQVATYAGLTVLAGIGWWSLVVAVAGRLAPLLERPALRRRVDAGTGVALIALAGWVGVG
jgi:threonine/homoserine/homoserine lactone efflux protein